ncbi:MAG: fumarylacetoacetate hydrolase family protein [Desulfobacterales bacterium]|nr:MAG: fumarylacetoacetate hydrolase family protein [Desulfobacterales bacterium]
MMEGKTITALAEALFVEHKAAKPYHPFEESIRSGSLADAYLIQEAFLKLLMEAGRGDLAGYKIALTSKAMQQLCGVDQPLAGAILSSVIHQSPAKLSYANFQHLGVEFEVAVRLGADLPAATSPHTRQSVSPAIAACMASFELIEDRQADYRKLDAFTLVADNCWNGGVVLGTPVRDWHRIDLENAPTRLRINDEPAGKGRVGDAMGHPFEAVAWLANLLNQQGKMLKRDMLVMTGSNITTKFPNAGDTLKFLIEGMGEVRLELTH